MIGTKTDPFIMSKAQYRELCMFLACAEQQMDQTPDPAKKAQIKAWAIRKITHDIPVLYEGCCIRVMG
jgi:hypothetical protein